MSVSALVHSVEDERLLVRQRTLCAAPPLDRKASSQPHQHIQPEALCNACISSRVATGAFRPGQKDTSPPPPTNPRQTLQTAVKLFQELEADFGLTTTSYPTTLRTQPFLPSNDNSLHNLTTSSPHPKKKFEHWQLCL